jgi:DNA-binding response OmpR family regulator
MQILIADDNRDAANGLARLINALGHSTFLAFDGLTALRLAERIRPDMVFLDLGLPDLSGYEVCKRIRALLREDLLAAIAVTGWSHERARSDSFEAGFDRHLVKPARLEAIADVIDDFAEQSSDSLW